MRDPHTHTHTQHGGVNKGNSVLPNTSASRGDGALRRLQVKVNQQGDGPDQRSRHQDTDDKQGGFQLRRVRQIERPRTFYFHFQLIMDGKMSRNNSWKHFTLPVCICLIYVCSVLDLNLTFYYLIASANHLSRARDVAS